MPGSGPLTPRSVDSAHWLLSAPSPWRQGEGGRGVRAAGRRARPRPHVQPTSYLAPLNSVTPASEQHEVASQSPLPPAALLTLGHISFSGPPIAPPGDRRGQPDAPRSWHALHLCLAPEV